ncbi:MAG: GMC oxidoreductase, partial [Pararhizobium sp.]
CDPLAAHILREVTPGDDVVTDADWEKFIRANAVTVFHPMGTCRMGTDAAAVVDPDLRVQGLEGLRVVDASIMPTPVSGNINATVIALAERASDMIRHRRG